MPESEAARILGVADRLAVQVKALAVQHTKSKRFSRWLAGSIVLDVVMSCFLGWNAVRTNDAVDQAKKASSTSRLACETANVTNAKNKDLWEFAFGLGSDPDQSEAEKARVVAFKAYIDRTFVQAECGP